jgi:hypothetical protein
VQHVTELPFGIGVGASIRTYTERSFSKYSAQRAYVHNNHNSPNTDRLRFLFFFFGKTGPMCFVFVFDLAYTELKRLVLKAPTARASGPQWACS